MSSLFSIVSPLGVHSTFPKKFWSLRNFTNYFDFGPHISRLVQNRRNFWNSSSPEDLEKKVTLFLRVFNVKITMEKHGFWGFYVVFPLTLKTLKKALFFSRSSGLEEFQKFLRFWTSLDIWGPKSKEFLKFLEYQKFLGKVECTPRGGIQ